MVRSNIAEQKQEAQRRIRRLPHARHVSDARIDKWIDDTLRLDDGRLLWHVDRLGGFGGSEMGGLVKSLRNEDDFYSTAHSVCAGKLCFVSPTSGDGHAERGQKMEPIARQEFERHLTRSGLNFRRLDDVQRDVIEGQDNPIYVWMRSSLDGLYDVEVAPGQWETWLVDFKCPTAGMVEKYKQECDKLQSSTGLTSAHGLLLPSSDDREAAGHTSSLSLSGYVHQLHHYYEDARLKGVQIDRMILSVLDYEAGLKPIQVEVAIDQRVINANIEAGEHYWHEWVQQGEVPDPIRKDIVVAENLSEKDLGRVQEVLQTRLLANLLQEHGKKIEDELSQDLRQRGKLAGATLDLGAMTVKGEPAVEEERAISRLQELGFSEEAIAAMRRPGVTDKASLMKRDRAYTDLGRHLVSNEVRRNPEQLREALRALRDLSATGPKQKIGDLDPEMVTEALLSCKEDANLFVQEKLSFSQTRKASIELDYNKDKAEELIRGVIAQIRKLKPQHEQDQEIGPTPGRM